jgi:hypothetical protein
VSVSTGGSLLGSGRGSGMTSLLAGAKQFLGELGARSPLAREGQVATGAGARLGGGFSELSSPDVSPRHRSGWNAQ